MKKTIQNHTAQLDKIGFADSVLENMFSGSVGSNLRGVCRRFFFLFLTVPDTVAARPKLELWKCSVCSGRHAMPQITLEISWFDVFRVVLWWLTIVASFHAGRFHGRRQVESISGSPQIEKSKSAPETDRAPEDDDPQVDTTSCGRTSSSSGAPVPEWRPEFPDIFMVADGKALHTTTSCQYLKRASPMLMRWCSKCGGDNKQRTKAE
jgi:hypothetical protein